MKIAICADDNHASANVSKRYARSNYFAIYDDHTKELKFVVNNAKEESSGAGNKATKILGELGVGILLAPKTGPKAFDMLEAFDIETYQYAENSSVSETLTRYYEGLFPRITHSEASGHSA